MTLTSAELLDGACDQCQRFLGPASKGISDAEGCGGFGCSDNELPGAAELEAPLVETDTEHFRPLERRRQYSNCV
jgi:hypothetical protein